MKEITKSRIDELIEEQEQFDNLIKKQEKIMFWSIGVMGFSIGFFVAVLLNAILHTIGA